MNIVQERMRTETAGWFTDLFKGKGKKDNDVVEESQTNIEEFDTSSLKDACETIKGMLDDCENGLYVDNVDILYKFWYDGEFDNAIKRANDLRAMLEQNKREIDTVTKNLSNIVETDFTKKAAHLKKKRAAASEADVDAVCNKVEEVINDMKNECKKMKNRLQAAHEALYPNGKEIYRSKQELEELLNDKNSKCVFLRDKIGYIGSSIENLMTDTEQMVQYINKSIELQKEEE